MTFDYYTLKNCAANGDRLGNWNGKAVFAASVNNLDNRGSGAYYILYDDENKIVAKTQSGWKSYGEVSEHGSVSEYSAPRTYRTPAEAAAEAKKASKKRTTYEVASTPTYAPGYDRTERPVGDVKTEIDVEATLKKAREMTIESLLEGFLPGVNYDVAKG